MRPTCTLCARKHLAQASILISEAVQGYPDHIWLALGHLAEASDELVQDHPQMANVIRHERKKLEESIGSTLYQINIPAIIFEVGRLPGAPSVMPQPTMTTTVEHQQKGLAELIAGNVPAGNYGPVMTREPIMTRSATDPDMLTSMSASTPAPELPVAILGGKCGIPESLGADHQSYGYHLMNWPSDAAVIAGYIAVLKPGKIVAYPLSKGLYCYYNRYGMRWIGSWDKLPDESFIQAEQTGLTWTTFQHRPTDKSTGKPAVMSKEDEARLMQDTNVIRKVLYCLVKDGLLAPDISPTSAIKNAPPLIAPATRAEAVPPPKAPCLNCQEAKELRQIAAGWRGQETSGIDKRVLVLAPLGDFNPSYSLVTVIVDQVKALATLPNASVVLCVRKHANLKLLPSMPANVEVLRMFPDIAVGDNDVTGSAEALKWLQTVLRHLQGGTVITHDLVFQSAFTHWAKAFHDLGDVPGVRFYHWMHSSVTTRPNLIQTPNAVWRCSVPKDHTMVMLNTTDLPYFQRYYDAQASSFITVLNPRDFRTFMGFTPAATTLATKHRLHEATYLQVYPLSATRMQAKGITKTIDVFKALHDFGQGEVRLVVADAHANGDEGRQQRTMVRQYADRIGLPAECLVFVSESLGTTDSEILTYGLDAASVHNLLQLSNVFVFPTTSEAGSLVLMEAALAGNLLVLNASLPCLVDYIGSEDAVWVPFGSAKESSGKWSPVEVAIRIDRELAKLPNRSRRAILQNHSLEGYARRMQSVLTFPPAGKGSTLELSIAPRPASIMPKHTGQMEAVPLSQITSTAPPSPG